MDGRWRRAALPYLLGVGGLGNLEALLEIGVPQRGIVVVIAVDDAAEWHVELVLFARQLQAVLDLGLLLPERIHARKILDGTLDERMQRLAEQFGPRVGETAE